MRGIAMLIILGLAACKSEPTFDERYATAQEKIEDKAEELEGELASPQDGHEGKESDPPESAD